MKFFKKNHKSVSNSLADEVVLGLNCYRGKWKRMSAIFVNDALSYERAVMFFIKASTHQFSVNNIENKEAR